MSVDGFDGRHVWAFCVRRDTLAGYPYTDDGEYGHDGEGILLGDVDARGLWEPREDSEYLTHEQLLELTTVDGIPCVTEEWDVVVTGFPTREAAEAYGREFGRQHTRLGWRVECQRASAWLVEKLSATA